MHHRLLALAALLPGCGGARVPASPPNAGAGATPSSEVAITRAAVGDRETPGVLAGRGVVQSDSSGQQTCGVTAEGRVLCAHLDGRIVELAGFPEAIAAEVGSGCGEPLCVITTDGTAVCVTTRHGNWDPRGRIEMPNVRDISLYGCFGCAVSRDGHLACFGGRQDHIAFLSPPRLVVGMENVVDVEVEAGRVCAQIGTDRIVCAPVE